MQADRPSVRLSEPLQGTLHRAGGTSAAMRALMVLGGLAAGEPLATLEHDVHRLLGDPSLAEHVRAALKRVSDVGQTRDGHVSVVFAAPLDDTPPPSAVEAEADPFSAMVIKL